ncbi:MAG: hypothetical protein AMXMBFR61_05350 [Fimbriimonadales bacterium]
MRLRVLLALGLVLSALVVIAQGGPGNVTLQAQDLDVRVALRALFTQTGLNYSVDPAVQGSVTISVKDVPFETALRLVLQQVKAEYVVEGGVYVVRPRTEEPPTVLTAEQPVDRLLEREQRIEVFTVRHADPYVIVMLLRGEQPTSPEWWTLHNLMGSGMPGFGGYGPGFGGQRFGGPGGIGQSQWGPGLGPGGATGTGPSGMPGIGPGGFPGAGGRPGSGNAPGGGRGMGASGGQGGIIEEGTLLVDPTTNRIIYIPPRR